MTFHGKKFNESFGCTDYNSKTETNGWWDIFLLVTYNKYFLYSSIQKIENSDWFSCNNEMFIIFFIEKILDDFLIIVWDRWELVHFHDIEPWVRKDKFFTCTIKLSDRFCNLNNLNTFHGIELPDSYFSQIITWENKISRLNVSNTSDDGSMTFQLFDQIYRIRVIFQL